MIIFYKLFFILITGVLSDSIPLDDSEEMDVHYQEESESTGESLGGPIDLNHQLQNLAILNNGGEHIDETPDNGWTNHIPGIPGMDYPNLDKIPITSFTCDGKIPGGYYADPEAGCQVFHICNVGGYASSFLCPKGSIFNQKYFVCDWWYGVRCEDSKFLYSELENQNNENNEAESHEHFTSDSISNYRQIDLHNNKGTNDLVLASSVEGGSEYAQTRLQMDNERAPLNNEQRDADQAAKTDRDLTHRDYSNQRSSGFQHSNAPNLSKNMFAIKKELYHSLEESINAQSRATESDEEFFTTKMPLKYFLDKTEHHSQLEYEPRRVSVDKKQPKKSIQYSEADKVSSGNEQFKTLSDFTENHDFSTTTSTLEHVIKDSSYISQSRFIPAL